MPRVPLFVVAAALGLMGWLVDPAVTLGVTGVVAVALIANWGLQRWIEANERPAELVDIPEGELVYQLRPRWYLGVVMILVIVGGFAATWTGIPKLIGIGFLAGLLGVVGIAVLIEGVAFKRRIRLTDGLLEFPRSVWSRESVTAALERVEVSTTEDDSILWISTGGERFAFNDAWIGEAEFRELVAALKQRTARARVRSARTAR